MGSLTLKRVPLDFDWPLGERWTGYLLPEEFQFPNCPDCNPDGCGEAGYNPETAIIARNFYANHLLYGSPEWKATRWCYKITQDEVQALVDEDRLIDFTHTLTPSEGWQPKNPPYVPMADEVNGWMPRVGLFGHDAINRWILVETRAKRLGVWGMCTTCNGHGDIATDEQREACDSWQEVDPSLGDGYQLWETVSEGSPQSPVFATPEELAEWCEPNATLSATQGASKEVWLELIKGDEGIDVEMGSMFIAHGNYIGPLATEPK